MEECSGLVSFLRNVTISNVLDPVKVSNMVTQILCCVKFFESMFMYFINR